MTGDDGNRDDLADIRPSFDAEGLTAIGPYQVQRFITEGGFAWVYEVSDPKFPMRRLALKMLKPAAARGEEFRRFESEARLIASFDHPNLVTVFDFGRDNSLGCYYYTMNFVGGPTLSAMGRLSIEDAAPIISAVLAGLTQLHNAHIVHRDIKPQNILTTIDGRAMLADLGIARDQRDAERFTRRGLTIGTIRYMAPEQARGVGVEPASDVFSMGLVLYEVLTGNSVYDKAANDQAILFELGAKFHNGEEFELSFPREVPQPIRDVIRKACRMAPAERYASAREMRDALQRALGELGPQSRFQWWQLALGLGALGLIAAVGWLGSYFWFRSQASVLDGQVAAVAQLAKGVLESVSAAQPPPDFAMFSTSQRQFEAAEATRQNGREEYEAGRYADSAAYSRLALLSFESLCERLSQQHLEPRLTGAREDLAARGAKLAELGAESLTPEPWREFQQKLTALQVPTPAATACEDAEQLRVLASDASDAFAMATAVFAELGKRLPDFARVARHEAETAREGAIRTRVDDALYRAAFERAEHAFAEGRAKADAGHHVEARDAFNASAADFDEAATLGGAIAARRLVKTAEARALERRVRDFGIASLVLSRAEEQFAARDWHAAHASYERAASEIDALVAPPEPVASPEPPPPPPTPVNRPPELWIAAESSVPLRVGQSRKFSAHPRDPDGDSVTVAFSVDSHPSSSGSEFTFTPAKPGRYRIAAVATDAEGATATDAVDVDVAANRAPSLDLDFDPPAGWRPGRQTLIVARTRDPEGDPVSVVYTVDGSEVASGDSYRFEPKRAGKYVIAAVATDALGARTTVQRVIDVGAAAPVPEPPLPVRNPTPTNRAPILAWASGGAGSEMRVGDEALLEATAADPDGDPVELHYEVNGHRVADGGAYRFRADSAGTFDVAAVGRDAHGALGLVARKITVVAPPAPIVTPGPSALDVAAQASKTLQLYAQAYEARDVERLRKVYQLNPQQVSSMASFFAAADRIGMEIRTLESQLEGDGTIVVDFDQRVTASNLQSSDKFIPLRATLSRQADNRWVIVAVRGR